MKRHECPDCEVHFVADACPRCGWTPPEVRKAEAAQDGRCTWTVLAGRCYLPGGIGRKAPLCTWHSHCQANPRLATEFEEFERWIESLTAMLYCAVWTHWRTDALWRAVRGEAPLGAAPLPCAASSCLYRVFDAEAPSARAWLRPPLAPVAVAMPAPVQALLPLRAVEVAPAPVLGSPAHVPGQVAQREGGT